jgi:hypothetical protein
VNSRPGIVSSNGTASVLFKLAGLKISDNQSPVPQDRFFYSFNYFDNLNASVDQKISSPVQNLQVYHQLFGIEKTILDGQASIGFRVPLNTISFKSTASYPGLGGSSTAAGDLSVFFKYAVYRQQNWLVSTGLQLTLPSGPGGFGGSKYYSYFRDTQIQPFVGYLYQKNRFYAQGFSSINVPSTSQDVTLLFNDASIGYYAYRSTDASRWVSAIVPTAEIHVTMPLNHRPCLDSRYRRYDLRHESRAETAGDPLGRLRHPGDRPEAVQRGIHHDAQLPLRRLETKSIGICPST